MRVTLPAVRGVPCSKPKRNRFRSDSMAFVKIKNNFTAFYLRSAHFMVNLQLLVGGRRCRENVYRSIQKVFQDEKVIRTD